MSEATVEIRVNGDPRNVPAGISVAELLEELSLARRRVAVEVNQEIVPRSRHGEHRLSAGDRVEIIRAIGGG